MLADDVEIIDHVPYRFDSRQLFAKYLNEVFGGIMSDELWLSAAVVPRVQRYGRDRERIRPVHGHDQGWQGADAQWANDAGIRQAGGRWKIESAHFSHMPQSSWARDGSIRFLEVSDEYQSLSG